MKKQPPSLQEGSAEVFDKIWAEQQGKKRFLTADAQLAGFIRERLDRFVEVGMPAGARILNCGCGKGTWSVPLSQRGFIVDNLDISENALKATAANYAAAGLTANLIAGDLRRLPFIDDTYDIVVSFGVLEHFADIHPIISEMVRVLKPGGLFLADIVTKRFSVRTLEENFNRLLGACGCLLRGQFAKMRLLLFSGAPDFFENDYSTDTYLQAAAKAGLTNVRIEGIRPYPIIALPSLLDRPAALCQRAASFLLKGLNYRPSSFSLRWCAVWGLYGIKPAGDNLK